MAAIKQLLPSQLLKALAHCKLCFQVTGAVFLAILIVEGAILIFSVNNFERDRLQELEREGLAVTRAWLQISGEKPQTLEKMAPMIGGGSVLLSAEVIDAKGEQVAYLKKETENVMKETFNVSWGPKDLGYPYIVNATLDCSELREQIIAFIWRIIGLVLLISFFVTVVTMIILEKLMLRPIRAFRDKMSEACTDLTNPEHYLLEQGRDDELGDVAKAYNSLLIRLSSAFKEIKKQQNDLENSNQKLESTVAERTEELNATVHDLRREAVERERAEKALDASNGGVSSEYLKRIAYTDTLTGLANRDLFMDRSRQVLRQIKRTDDKAALHLIDIDQFSSINERFGQKCGDLVLQTVADRLNDLIRESDTLARLSADEFALMQLDVADSDQASILAQRITERLHMPIELDDETIEIDASIGITLLPMDDDSIEDVLHHVALAKRRAKEDQGSSYHFYADEMNREALERQEIERDLKTAIENGELEVYYQPKLDLHSCQISGMESLVRWHHPEKGFMSPAKFIPIAERSHLIIDLGDYVLRQAAAQARRWQVEGLGDLKVAVNVSAVQLQETCMVTSVRQILIETGLPPHLLELEITESAVMENVEDTITVLENLRALGISLSIDDFGTGYSSLNYLKRFPVQRIKIDKAFVDEIENESSDGVIARAVITMGHSLGMEITAEGVELPDQQSFLEKQGCDEIQGYLFGKPMPAGDFRDFVMSSHALAAE